MSDSESGRDAGRRGSEVIFQITGPTSAPQYASEAKQPNDAHRTRTPSPTPVAAGACGVALAVNSQYDNSTAARRLCGGKWQRRAPASGIALKAR